jgi:hypothetical protein
VGFLPLHTGFKPCEVADFLVQSTHLALHQEVFPLNLVNRPRWRNV